MPTIIFESQTTTTGIRITCDGVTFRNFELKNCKDGILVESADDVELENLLIHKVGDTTLGTDEGVAIKSSFSSCLIVNCFIVDAHGQGVVLKGDSASGINCVVDTTVVSSNEDTDPDAGTDYYFNVSNSDDNIIDGCYAIRFHEDPRDGTSLVSGHKGFVIQGSSSGNDIVDCAALRLIDGFLLRGEDVTANAIYDCISIGDSDGDVEEADGKISIDSGPHGNSFSRVRVQGGDYGVSFESESLGTISSDGNRFDNCIFQECAVAAIHMNPCEDSGADDVVDTKFVHCTFVNTGGAFIENDRNGNDNEIVSSIVTGFDEFESSSVNHGFSLGYCCTFDNTSGFPTPFEDEDAEFASTLTGVHPRLNMQFYTWDLTSGSPCIDRVPKYSGISLLDYDEDTRLDQAGLIWDIGAQEY